MNTPLHCAKTWQLRKLVKGQAREIQELRGAGLHISEPYTGHTWCLLSWEAQYTIIGINSILFNQGVGPTYRHSFKLRGKRRAKRWRMRSLSASLIKRSRGRFGS